MSDFNDQLGWLIRDSSNVIRGPFPRAEILQQLKKNQLKGKTELARANSYWFGLEEKVEVARFFPELGGPRPPEEQGTQMTATLTQAGTEQNVEVTQFVPSPTRRDLPQAAKAADEQPRVEWLDDEAAAEFMDGIEDFTATVGVDMPTETGIPSATAPVPLPENDPDATQRMEHRPNDATQRISPEELARMSAREAMMTRAQVKADTLPSEHHDYQGEAPQPLNPLFRSEPRSNVGHEKASSVNSERTGSTAAPAASRPDRKRLYLVGGAVALALVAGGALLFTPGASNKAPATSAKTLASIEPMLKKSLLLFDLEGAKSALADYELRPESKGQPILPLAQALLRKEFLYDTEGAIGLLQMAHTLAREPKITAEIDNLLAVYKFEREPGAATEELRKVAEANPTVPVFRYNHALALMRQNKPVDAARSLAILFPNLPKDDPLWADAALLLGWARDAVSRGNDLGAEGAYQKALEANPNLAKARVGIAIARLRKGGLKESESDFRAFVESLPDLDPPSSVPKFRQMSDFDFYRYVRSQIADLNTPGSAVGNKPSAVIMATDAIISAVQSQTSDADKIVADAVKLAPGDSYALKAMGYLLWKEGKYAEIADLLKEGSHDRSSFALNYLLAKVSLKLGRRPAAAEYAENLTVTNALRSEGWSLLGDIHLQDGKADEARQNFRQALAKNPLDLAALRGLDHLKDNGVVSPEVARNLPF